MYLCKQTQWKSQQLVIFWIYCMTGTSGGKLNNARRRNWVKIFLWACSSQTCEQLVPIAVSSKPPQLGQVKAFSWSLTIWQPSEIGCESVPHALRGTETSSWSFGSQQHLSCFGSHFRALHLLRQCCTLAWTAREGPTGISHTPSKG